MELNISGGSICVSLSVIVKKKGIWDQFDRIGSSVFCGQVWVWIQVARGIISFRPFAKMLFITRSNWM